MAFDLKNFFMGVFKPQPGEIVTIMIDEPHGPIADTKAWQDRRTMAREWREKLVSLAGELQITVRPLVTYQATGSNNADLPADCLIEGQKAILKDVVLQSTIILAMPQFSATAPLFFLTKQTRKLRVGSMPGVARFMEKSGLAADYQVVAARCQKVADLVNQAIGAEVEFSTGQQCYFDLPLSHPAHIDDGILYPEKGGTDSALSNLPAGEVYTVPNEDETSLTAGELPQKIKNLLLVYVIKNNRVVDVKGKSKLAAELRAKFAADPAWRNIAEFAIGLNDKARVTGNVLEDEKAGFHWAYGRSDHFGGKVGVASFKSPANVVHQDIVYAKESPIICQKLNLVFPDGSKKLLISKGEILA